jgi:hypothetical protein
LPLAADQVDVTVPFRPEELLYRRVSTSELGPGGEIYPSRIEAVTFKAQVQTAPSVMRSAFSLPRDVLHFSCARRDTTDWSVFSILVNALPMNLMAGDGRAFRFFPVHIPEPDCGAHSVIGCCIQSDLTNTYVKPSSKVIWEFKVKFALALSPVPLEPPADLTRRSRLIAIVAYGLQTVVTKLLGKFRRPR